MYNPRATFRFYILYFQQNYEKCFHISQFFVENENKFYIHRHVASRYIDVRKFFMRAESNILSFPL